MFAVTILGNNSALPAFDRHPTAQVVTLSDQVILFDCGEGTQKQLSYYKIKRSKINYIFISHLHGDHYFGFVPLITSMSLLGREAPLYVFAPPLLQDILQLQLNAANTQLGFTIHFTALTKEEILVDNNKFTISSIATKHRIPCFGFKIVEKKPPRKLNKEAAVAHEVPAAYYESLKQGLDYTKKDGSLIANSLVTFANTPARSYAYLADTIYDETLIEKVRDLDMIYHETTYLKDAEDRAATRFHSTTLQAATIAQKANVKRLLIGHFSSKYEDLQPFLTETKTIFANTQLAIEGVTFKL